MLTKQRTNFFICISSLILGGILYILFRENTHIGKLFAQIFPLTILKALLKPFASNLLCFHLLDFLWGLSLGCGLQTILMLKRKRVLLCGLGVFLCGAIWESLQFLDVVSGTGDYWDIVSYFLAGALCITFNLKETEK